MTDTRSEESGAIAVDAAKDLAMPPGFDRGPAQLERTGESLVATIARAVVEAHEQGRIDVAESLIKVLSDAVKSTRPGTVLPFRRK